MNPQTFTPRNEGILPAGILILLANSLLLLSLFIKNWGKFNPFPIDHKKTI